MAKPTFTPGAAQVNLRRVRLRAARRDRANRDARRREVAEWTARNADDAAELVELAKTVAIIIGIIAFIIGLATFVAKSRTTAAEVAKACEVASACITPGPGR